MYHKGKGGSEEAVFSSFRRDMVAEVVAMAGDTSLTFGGARPLSPAVLEALGRVPRHRFVPEEARDFAYENRPLPIGYGQTISQPYIVAFMSDLLAVKPGDRVLEIGTGCGYQSAVLAEMGVEVYSVEIVEALAKQAAETLGALGYDNVHTKAGDGYQGWPEYAPFDGVIVTAGASHVPQPLLDQLKPGGRMVIPLGAAYYAQELLLVEKDMHGKVSSHEVLPVRFVPLTGGH